MKKKKTVRQELDMKELMTNYHKILWYYVNHKHPTDEEVLKKLNGAFWVITIIVSMKYKNISDIIPDAMIVDVNELSAKKIEQFLSKLEDEVDEKIFTIEL